MASTAAPAGAAPPSGDTHLNPVAGNCDCDGYGYCIRTCLARPDSLRLCITDLDSEYESLVSTGTPAWHCQAGHCQWKLRLGAPPPGRADHAGPCPGSEAD